MESSGGKGWAGCSTKVCVIQPEQEREVVLSRDVVLSKDVMLSRVASMRTDQGLPSCCSDTRHRQVQRTHLRPGFSQSMKLVVPLQKKKNL